MTDDKRSLAEQARELGIADPSFLRAVEKVEGAAASKSMAVVRNGEFPRWSVERWLLIAGVVVTVSTNLLDVGGKYKGIEMRQEQMTQAIEVVEHKVDAVWSDLGDVKVEQARVRTQLDIEADREPGAKRTPSFGPSYGTVR